MRLAIHRLLLFTAVCTVLPAQDGDILRASQLIGMEVRSATNDVVGSVEDVVLDRQTGGVSYAVVSYDGIPNRTGMLFAVPWQALAPAQNRKALLLAVSTAALANVPGFDPNKWPDMSAPRWVAAVGSAFGVRARPRASRTDDEPRVIGTRETSVRAPRPAAIVTGTVKSMLPGESSEIVIDTGQGDVGVVLGPISYLDEQRLTFNPNANVSVQVSRTVDRDGPRLVATAAATHPGQWVPIRSNDLTPAWSDAAVDADTPLQLRDLTGTVVYAGSGFATVLTEDEGVRVVTIAPASYLESRHWTFRKNPRITVTGYDDPISRNFVAITIEQGNATWRVRRDNGTPLWSDGN